MIRTNRRHRLLFLALAGMDIAWSLPFVQFFLERWLARGGSSTGSVDGLSLLSQAPLALFVFFWAVMIGYMYAADWLNQRQIDSPRRELVIIALVLLSTLVSEIVLVYSTSLASGNGWFMDLVGSIFDFTNGVRPALILFVYNLFIWWRVSLSTGRDLGFFAVGVNFRLGMLFAIVGCSMLALVSQRPWHAILYFLLFFAYGLTVSAISRMDDKAWLADHSTGALLPWKRFLQLIAAVAATMLAAIGVSALLSPAAFRVYGRALAPLLAFLAPVGSVLIAALIWVLTPLFNFLEWLVQLIRNQMPEQLPTEAAELQPFQDDFGTLTDLVRDFSMFRYALVAIAIVVALLLIWIFFVRTVAAFRPDQAEEAAPDDLLEEPTAPRAGRWRNWLGLLSRYGMGRNLLAAISVQNLYANVTRLARRRGYPRENAMPPDRYLPRLTQAFPGNDEALHRLTNAYMRVHYGELPATSDELRQLRADYEAIRATPRVIRDE